MLDILNLGSAVCQLYLSKMEKKEVLDSRPVLSI